MSKSFKIFQNHLNFYITVTVENCDIIVKIEMILKDLPVYTIAYTTVIMSYIMSKLTLCERHLTSKDITTLQHAHCIVHI